VTRLRAGRSGVPIPAGSKDVSLLQNFQSSSQGPPGLLMYVYRGVSSLGPKRPGLEANQSLPSSAEVKSKCSYNPLPHNVFTQCTKTALILTERNNHCSFWVNMNISFPVHGRRLGTYLKKFPVHSALCHSVCRAPSDTVQCSTAVDSVVIISDIFHTYSTGNCCSLCTDFSLAQFTFRQPTGC